jgi:ABC-type branched-subunit amino acid transport system permease subunit
MPNLKNLTLGFILGVFIVAIAGIIYAHDVENPPVSSAHLTIFMWAVGGLLAAGSALVGVIYFTLSRRVDDLSRITVGIPVHKEAMESHKSHMSYLQSEIESRDAEIDAIWKELRAQFPQELMRSIVDLKIQITTLETNMKVMMMVMQKSGE